MVKTMPCLSRGVGHVPRRIGIDTHTVRNKDLARLERLAFKRHSNVAAKHVLCSLEKDLRTCRNLGTNTQCLERGGLD